MTMKRILLVDDDKELVDMLQSYLAAEGFELMVAYDGASGCQLALSGGFDLAVVDVMMPGMDGVAVLQEIRAKSRLPVLMLTARGDEVDRVLGLEMGADDYVPKPCTPRELAARIRAILRRGEPAQNGDSNAPVFAGALVMWPALRQVEWCGRRIELTSTEFDVLLVLAQRAGQTVSKADISLIALQRPMTRYDRSIDMHISTIRNKLGPQSDGRSCIQTVFRKGYQLICESRSGG